ncbi:uncharacterized protein BDZ99DRAFT_286956 [Mytilinidion resinicola]|uniref:Uncharacterized protein n=1 Tax=Mytilinidion resinicola TaxID=574789 RepID=A0A6A6YPJ9_9PEZI|nr:uncharacterized protein BDZ99DRAFT_286956 [Mytilinidion resinicola]KAF2810681.1 hypothetical protein BDZ99DRAFT_286956 [Mytilinidion resinicola]
MVAKSDAIQHARLASIKAPKQPRPPKPTLLSTGGFQRSERLRLDQPPPNAFVVPITVTKTPKAGRVTAQRAVAGPAVSFLSVAESSPSPPAMDPEYKFRVFSLDSSTSDEVLRPSKTAQDLIFSITLTNSPASFELNTYLFPSSSAASTTTTRKGLWKTIKDQAAL